jgi:hypothetical protein
MYCHFYLQQTTVKPPMAVTNAVSWRSEGIRHKKNEVFLDVVESVNLLVNSNGNVVLSEVMCGTTSTGMHVDAIVAEKMQHGWLCMCGANSNGNLVLSEVRQNRQMHM